MTQIIIIWTFKLINCNVPINKVGQIESKKGSAFFKSRLCYKCQHACSSCCLQAVLQLLLASSAAIVACKQCCDAPNLGALLPSLWQNNCVEQINNDVIAISYLSCFTIKGRWCIFCIAIICFGLKLQPGYAFDKLCLFQESLSQSKKYFFRCFFVATYISKFAKFNENYFMLEPQRNGWGWQSTDEELRLLNQLPWVRILAPLGQRSALNDIF